MSSNASSISDVRQALEHNVQTADKALSKIETDFEFSMKTAEMNYKKDKKAWEAHVGKRWAKKAAKTVAGTVIDHFTVIGSIVLEGYAAYWTDKHIDNLRKVRDSYRCSCKADKDSKIDEKHCELVLMPYVLTQKGRKFNHAIVAAMPLAGTAQAVADKVHAAAKKDLHADREQRARELMKACKGGCLMANAIGAELLGSFSDIAAQTKLEAYKADSEGWRYLYEKLSPT